MSRNNKTSQKRRHANFTMLEILVIIAVMAILFAILVPSLKRAKIYANDALCISNLRQIAYGMKNYLHDYNNKWPDVVYFIDDYGPYAPYIKNLNVLRCPGREQVASMYDSGNILRMTDYLLGGTIADNEKHNNYNNGHGNNPYHFDPSNPSKPTQAIMAAKSNNRNVIFERQHSNHYPRRLNMMYLDTFSYDQNTKGMQEFWTLDDRGWIDTSLDPWPSYDTSNGNSGGGTTGGGGGNGGGKK